MPLLCDSQSSGTRIKHSSCIFPLVEQYDSRTDAELLAAMQHGDKAAFESLYHRYRDWVLRLAFRFTRNEQDALDITQDAFIHLHSRPPTFALTGKLTTYLYPVVKNLALAAVRRRDRHPSSTFEPDSLPARAESQSTELEHVVSRLPEGQREVLLMRFVDDMTLAEITEALSIPLGTVKSRLHLAIQSLRADPRTRDYFETK